MDKPYQILNFAHLGFDFLPLTVNRPTAQKGRSGDYWRSSLSSDEEAVIAPLVRAVKKALDFHKGPRTTLLHMPTGAQLTEHTDGVPGRAQALYMIQPATAGGVLHLRLDGVLTPLPTQAGECVVFNANRIRHSVSEVTAGDRHVLSLWF